MRSRARLRRIALAVPVLAAGFFACSDDSSDSPMMPPPATTGVLRGAVLDNLTSAPIAGAIVTTRVPGGRVGGILTDVAGRFEIPELDAGEIEILIDATAILPTGNPDVHYTDIALHETVVAGETIDIAHPVFLPRIDESQATEVDGVTPTTVEPPSIPGLAMDIAAGAATFPGGGATGGISIVEIPIDRAPMSLPPGTAPSMLISIQPAGTTFDPPAPLRFPNVEGFPPDFELDILSMDPIDGEFILSSRGRVTPDGAYIETVPGTGNGGVAAASWHAAICDAHTVTGVVVDGLGAPVAGATVEVLSGINSSTGEPVVVEGGTATTDSSGRYTIPDVRVCEVRVRVTQATSGGAGEATFDGGLLADADGTTEVPDITLVVQSGVVAFDVTGVVTLADGTVAPGAIVEWFNFGGRGDTVIDVADATGTYLLEGLVMNPGAQFDVFASQNESDAFGEGEGVAPDLADNGSTVTVDIILCTEDDIEFVCPVGDWSLDGSNLTITQPFAGGCADFDIAGIIEVVSLVNGEMVVSITDDGSSFEIDFVRIQGSGATGVSTANLPGIYRQVGGFGEERFVQIRSTGDIGVIEGVPDPSTSFEAGTYAVSGGEITVTPNYDSGGTPEDPFTIPFSVSGNTLTVTNEDGPETFTRCEHSSGSGLDGFWFIVDGLTVRSYLAISGGEYASGNFNKGRRPLAADHAFHQAVTGRLIQPEAWGR